jgi:molybdate transport system substrate-binding protein
MRFLRLAFLILLTLALFACGVAPPPADTGGSETRSPAETEPTPASSVKSRGLIVFAAASLTEAFGEIGTLFESQNPGTTVTFNFAGSNQLAQQIGQGAPADLFASANAMQMGVAIESGRVITGTQQTFVRNRLVVITPADNPGGINTLQDLTTPGLKIVFAADAVPVGQYSVEFLEKASKDSGFIANYKDAVIANVVSYEENVRSVLSKVVLGEADAGIVYTSDITQNSREQVAQIEIPDGLNVIASYPIAPVTDSANSELAAEFIALVLSPEGQAILTRYGFIGVADAAAFMPVALEGRKQ